MTSHGKSVIKAKATASNISEQQPNNSLKRRSLQGNGAKKNPLLETSLTFKKNKLLNRLQKHLICLNV